MNREIVQEYRDYYFDKYPKRKKFYLESNKGVLFYTVLSLNDIVIINNYGARKTIKGKWDEFGKWLCEKNGFMNKKIKNAAVEVIIFSENKLNKDCSNFIGGFKFLEDGLFVKSNMFMSDSYKYINPLITDIRYDPDNPRTEIRITTFPESQKDIYYKIKKHVKVWEKTLDKKE